MAMEITITWMEGLIIAGISSMANVSLVITLDKK